jgi:hypothetical protein
MQKLILLAVALTFAGCSGAAPGPNPALQVPASNASLSWRFIGLDALKGKTNLVVFREAAGLKEYEGFKSNLTARIAERLATAAAGTNAESAELQKLLTPVAADLIHYPSVFEKGPSNICSLAVQLPNDRHDIWQKNWDGILKATKIPNAKISREGAWTLISNGGSKAILDRAKNPGPEVFQFDGDGAILKKWLPDLSPKKATMKVTTQGNNLRSEGKVTLENDAAVKLGTWDIPRETIREPLVAFTAIQGTSNWLAKFPIFKDFKAPNQVFLWSTDDTPFSAYVAARVGDSTNFVRSVADKLTKEGKGKIFGQLQVNTNIHRVILMGLPLERPFLGVAKDPGFVFGGPLSIDNPESKPLPPELASQVTGRTNLLFYDWEFTGARIWQVRPISQSFAIAQNKPLPSFDSRCAPLVGGVAKEIWKFHHRSFADESARAKFCASF